MTSTRDTIWSAVRAVAAEHDKALPPLSDELVLTDTGLDSLCFAILIARLEAELGVDPFASAEEVEFPVTLGDLVRTYDAAVVARQAA